MSGFSFADDTIRLEVGPADVQLLTTPVESMVNIHGSFRSEPDQGAGDRLLQIITVSLLDKGTTSRDRFALAQALEDRGAKLNVFSDGLRIGFTCKSLTGDVPVVVETLGEILREPSFDEEEFEKARSRVAARYRRMMESTSQQAKAALSRRLFPDRHPNFSPDPRGQLERLIQISVEDVRAYYRAHFGADDLEIVGVGDLEEEVLVEALEEALGGWSPHETESTVELDPRGVEPGRERVDMADKDSVDVCMGHPVPVRRQDEAYVPLYLGNYVLGGNFSARLMTIVRDEKGLTYGIGSALSGVDTEYPGYWQIHVTLSSDRVEEGIEATRAVARDLVEGGITEEELADKKTTLTGSYRVRQAKTSGLASMLLTNAERGFDLEYLDRYPGLIEATTLEEVNDALATHLDPDELSEALAGTLETADAA